MPQPTQPAKKAPAAKRKPSSTSGATPPRTTTPAVQTGADNARAREENGQGERMPVQLERQERAYDMHCLGMTVRQIGAALAKDFGVDRKAVKDGGRPVDKNTVCRDIREERARRVAARGEADAEQMRADTIAVYQQAVRRGFADDNPKTRPHSIANAIKAQERIDKIRGIDAPTKIDTGLEGLLKALDAD